VAARGRSRVAVSITADNAPLKRGVKESERDLGRLQRVGVSSTRGLSAGFKAAGGIIAGAAVADQIRQTVVAAQEAQVSQAKLAAQLKASGISYRAHAAEIDRVIQKTSKLAGLDDEDLQDAFTNIVRSTGNVSKSLRLTGLAADFARAKHIDVAKAGQLIGKVAAGNVSALSRYGVSVKKGATAEEALAAAQRKFAGQAQAYGKTSAGAQDRFRVAVENLREAVGAKLLPVLTKLTTKAADFVNQMTDGTGAGGRFAAKLKDIADRARPIVKFFTDHPKLIAIAVAAWVAYRVAAAAAMAATRLKALGMFKGLARPAAIAGAESGAAFGTAASTSASSRFGGGFGKGLRGLVGRMGGPGRLLGAALGTALIAEVVSKLHDPSGGLSSVLKDIGNVVLPFQPRPGGPGRKLPVTHASPDGKHLLPGPAPTVKVKPSAGSQNAPDNRPRAHTSSVRAHAASVGTVAHASRATGGTYTASQLAALWVSAGGNPASADIAAAVAMAESGGRSSAENHNTNGSIDRGLWQINSIHGALSTFDVRGNAKAAVSISGNGRNWSPWVTYQTGAYRQFLGRSGKVSAGSVAAVTTAGAVAPVATKRKTILSAALERGQSGSPNRTALGRKRPKVTGTLFTQALRPADPQAQAKNMRLFQIGNRRIKILDDIKRGKVKTPGTLQRLSEELGSLDSEQKELLGTDATGLDAIPGASAYFGKLDKDAALAALTPDTGDDLAAANARVTATENVLAYAQSHGFSDADIASAAGDVKSARDARDSITGATTDNTDAIKALTDELKRTNDLNEHILGVTSGQWQKAFADMVNGQLGGYVDSRARTAGDGSLTRV
jgi:hypothetical protein